VTRPGRMHDQTAVRTEGIAEQFRLHPTMRAKVASGYQGLAKEFPTRSVPRRRNWRTMRVRATSGPGARRAAASPRNGRRGTHQRRVQTLAPAPALHRPARGLRRDPPGHRRPGFRPIRPPGNPPHDEYRTGPRPHDSLLTASYGCRRTATRSISTSLRSNVDPTVVRTG
jgi:hypothetical protein